MAVRPIPARRADGSVKPVRTITAIAGTPVSKPFNIPAAAVERFNPDTIFSDGRKFSDGAAYIPQKIGGSTLDREMTSRQRTASPVTDYTTGSAVPQVTNTPPPAKKKFGKTIVGKILKGAAIVGGSALAIGAIVGTGGAAAAGAPLLGGAIGGAGKVIKVVGGGLSKVSQAAVNLITGTTKQEREQVRGVKSEARAAANQLEQVDRLVKAGSTAEAARAMVGLSSADLSEYDGKPLQAGISTNTILLIGGLAAAALLLPKLLRR